MNVNPMIAAKVTRAEKGFVRAAAAMHGESESALIRRIVLPEAARILSSSAERYTQEDTGDPAGSTS